MMTGAFWGETPFDAEADLAGGFAGIGVDGAAGSLPVPSMIALLGAFGSLS
jgi:hypothetical protein